MREFDGKLLLASYLLDHGFDVVIGSRKRVKEYVLLHDRCVYVAKSITKAERVFYEEIRQRGNAIVLLQVEGGILYKEADEAICYSYPQELLPFLDRIFVFGEAIKSHILRLLEVDEHRITVTGEPRFDLLKSKYSNFLNNRAAQIVKCYGNYILINTSFGLSNHLISKSYARNLIEFNPDFSERLKHNLLLKQEEFEVLVALYRDMVAAVARDFPEHKVILRPHPEENLEYYKKHLEGWANVEVINNGNVAYWIAGAKAVVHYDCTTGVEAWMACKPVVSYTPFINEDIVAWLPLLVSHKCQTEEDVIEALRDALVGKLGPKVLDEKEYRKVAAHIHNIVDESGPLFLAGIQDVENERFAQKAAPGASAWKRGMFIGKNIFRDYYHQYIKPPTLTTETHKIGTITSREIRSVLRDFYHVHGLESRYSICPLGEHLVRIKSKV